MSRTICRHLHLQWMLKKNQFTGPAVTDKRLIEQNESMISLAISSERLAESRDIQASLPKNSARDPDFAGFSITKCVKCLEATVGLDSNMYLKAINMFKDGYWGENVYDDVCAEKIGLAE